VCATRISSQIHNAIRCGQYPFLLPECMHLRAYLATPVHLESALNMSLLCRDAQPSKRSATITPCVPAYLRHWGRYRFETSGAKTMHSSRVHPRIMNSRLVIDLKASRSVDLRCDEMHICLCRKRESASRSLDNVLVSGRESYDLPACSFSWASGLALMLSLPNSAAR
jgi:hypothetical protein